MCDEMRSPELAWDDSRGFYSKPQGHDYPPYICECGQSVCYACAEETVREYDGLQYVCKVCGLWTKRKENP